ncbi:MAG: preprotein translocase subunit YajC [Magnetococcus sp. WYHC-3]
MMDLISPAYAQTAPAPAEAGLIQIGFWVLLFAIFYFLLIRPQQKQVKAHKEMVTNLSRGDTVLTGGGLLGKVHRVEDDVAVVELGEVEIDSKTFKPLRVRVKKATIAQVTAKAVGGGDTVPAKAPGKAE